MTLSFERNRKILRFEEKNPLDISIPMKFNGDQPNAYGVERAKSVPCEAGQLVGDTRQGGSCNFEQYTFIPHCNGTHTECIGHITNERISVRECLKDAFLTAALISVEAENSRETDERYSIEFAENDLLITRNVIENALADLKSSALIIRTLPNNNSRLTQNYGDYIPPFFTNEAMGLIVETGIEHLLVDLPSIDRIFDDGKLSNHRKFWQVDNGKFETNENSRINSTITELVFVPNEIEDGDYLLNLQIAPFESDVSPSRPLLFKIETTN